MTSAQYEKAIAALGLNDEEAAELLGVDVRSHFRWRSGERAISGSAVNFLRFLLATKRSGSYAIKQIKKGR